MLPGRRDEILSTVVAGRMKMRMMIMRTNILKLILLGTVLRAKSHSVFTKIL